MEYSSQAHEPNERNRVSSTDKLKEAAGGRLYDEDARAEVSQPSALQKMMENSRRVAYGADLQDRVDRSLPVPPAVRIAQLFTGPQRPVQLCEGEGPIQMISSWSDFRVPGVYGTRRALTDYHDHLLDCYTQALCGGSYLSRGQKEELRSYKYQLDIIPVEINRLPDDEGDRPDGGGGKWSVRGAGVQNVKGWLARLNDTCKETSGRNLLDQKRLILNLCDTVQPIIELYYELSRQEPAPTPTVDPTGEDENEIIMYRRMWQGEADIVLDRGVLAAMGPNDNYKKYFTTDLSHTQSFQNANAVNPDEEVIVKFVLDWDGYWEFAQQHGAPNQKKGALADKNTAIMNQERIVRGIGANFRVDAQVNQVIENKQHHNIGVGQGNAAAFDAIIKSKEIIG